MRSPILSTDRIVLRELTHEDTQAVFELFSFEEVSRFVDFSPSEASEDARYIIDWGSGIYRDGDGVLWGVFARKDGEEGRLIGYLAYLFIDGGAADDRTHRTTLQAATDPFCDIALMQEAVTISLHHIFDTLGFDRIESVIDPENTSFLSLLNAIGFRREGLLRHYRMQFGTVHDLELYALLRTDLRQQLQHGTVAHYAARLLSQAESILTLLTGQPERLLRRRPAPDRWHAIDVLNHLIIEEREDFLPALLMITRSPDTPWPVVSSIDTIGPAAAREGKLPATYVDDPELAMRSFFTERLCQLRKLEELGDVDLSTIHRGTRPFPETISAGDVLASWAAHDLIHLEQLIGLINGARMSEDDQGSAASLPAEHSYATRYAGRLG